MKSPLHRAPAALLLLLLLASLLQPARALDPGKALTQYVHTAWRTDDGLPQNSVTALLQTRDGFLWVGTQAGLARFDGVRFTRFDHTNTPVFRSDFITDLVEDAAGTLWIGTWNDGVFRYRDGRFTRLAGIGARDGIRLALDSSGNLWVGGEHGVRRVRDGVVKAIHTSRNGLASDQILSLAVDARQSLWIGTRAGLHRLHAGRMRTFLPRDGLPNEEITGLFPTRDGMLWVKTRNAEVARWTGHRFEPWHLPGVTGGTVREIHLDKDGNLWLASGSEGLLRVRDGVVSRFDTGDGLTSDAAVKIYEDRNGNLWVGTTAGGLDRFRDGLFRSYAKEEGLSADQTSSVIQDSAGDMWVSTRNGLDRLRGDQVRTWRADDKRLDTWALWDTGAGLLAGTSSVGVLRLDGDHLALQLSERHGIPPYHVSAIIDDDAGRLWVATRGGGLAQVEGDRTRLFTRSDGLNSDTLFAMARAADGAIWIGSDDGLNTLVGGRVFPGPAAATLADALVISLYFDRRQVLWIGTFGRGLFRLENGRLTRFTTHQGLAGDTINSILEDSDRNLWIGTDHLVARLERAQLDAVAAGTLKALSPMTFGKADGMKSAETTGGSQPSAWRGRDGRLWFATNRGVAVADPARLSFREQLPRAHIEALLADEQVIDVGGDIALPAGTRRLAFAFTAPNLSSPERTRFRYRLDGLDTEWVDGRTARVANYTNLSSGPYRFRVNARIENGAWHPHEASLAFELAPHVYETAWFRLLCAIAVLSALWGLYRVRVAWLHARAAVMEERQRIGSEIHDSLAQGLSGIIFQTDAALLGIPPGAAHVRVSAARDLAKASLDDARYSVWGLSPPVLDQKDLAESIPSMARQLAHGRVDDLEIVISGQAWTLPPEANHHIVMITQEAVSNAIQHGRARTIVIKLAYEPDALHLSVADDGQGFTPEPATGGGRRGHGMRNMRHRADSLGARLELASEVGQGTRVTLDVPRVGRLERAWRLLGGRRGVSGSHA